MEPGSEAALPPEGAELPEGPQEDLLRQIVGPAPVAAHAGAERVDAPHVLPVVALEGPGVAVEGPAHEVALFGAGVHHPPQPTLCGLRFHPGVERGGSGGGIPGNMTPFLCVSAGSPRPDKIEGSNMWMRRRLFAL